jgi:hypothetical protein
MIIFDDKLHESKWVNLPEFGNVLIAKITLRDVLLNDVCEYTSKEAAVIDESIFFYVQDDDFNRNNKSLSKLMMSQIK